MRVQAMPTSASARSTRDGCRVAPGCYDWAPPREAFSVLTEAPAIIMLAEALDWAPWGANHSPNAAEELSDQLDACYVGLLGTSDRGPSPTAVLYDAQRVSPRFWGNDHTTVWDDQRNRATMITRDGKHQFHVVVDQWSYCDDLIRLHRANSLGRYGSDRIPTIVGCAL